MKLLLNDDLQISIIGYEQIVLVNAFPFFPSHVQCCSVTKMA